MKITRNFKAIDKSTTNDGKSKDKEKSRKNSKEKLRLADEKTFSEDMLKR